MRQRMTRNRRQGGGNLDASPMIADPNWWQSREAELMLVDQGAVLFSGPGNDGTNPYIAINNPLTLPGTIVLGDPDFNPTNYNSAAALDRFSIGQASVIYKGKHRVAWAQGPYGENTIDEYVAENVCDDGISFVTTNKTVLAAADEINGICRSHGAYHIHPDDGDPDGVLYFLCPGFIRALNPEPIFKNLRTHLYRLDNPNTISEVWTHIGEVGEIFPLQSPILMDDGNYIMAGGDCYTNPGIMISQGSDITLEWRKIEIKTPGFTWASLSETNIYKVVGNHLEVVIRAQSNLPGEQGYAFSSKSDDFGRTWTKAAPSRLLSQSKKLCAGETFEGVKFIVYCLWGLDNMVLAWDSDGDGLVDKHYEIVPISPPAAYWTYTPNTGSGALPSTYTTSGVHRASWGYASYAEDDDYLYIDFFNSKEDIWRIRIKKALALYGAAVEAGAVVKFTFSESQSNASKADSSGFGYDATAHYVSDGSHTSTALPYRYVAPRRDTWYMTFDGSGQYIDFPHPTQLRAFNSFWMAGWVRFLSLGANRTIAGQYGARVASGSVYGKGFYCFRLSTGALAGDKWTIFVSPRGGITGAHAISYDAPSVGVNYYVYAEWNAETMTPRLVVVTEGVPTTDAQNNPDEKIPTTTDTDAPPIRAYHDSSEKIYIGAAQGPSSAPVIDVHNGYVGKFEMGNNPLTLAEIYAKCQADTPYTYTGYTQEATAVMNRFINIASVGRRTLIQQLIEDIKAVGIWSSHMAHMWMVGAEDDQMALVDWVDVGGVNLTRTGRSALYTVDRGYTGNASHSMTGPALNASSKYGQDDAHIGCVVLSNAQENRGELGLAGSIILRTNIASPTAGAMVTAFNNSGSGVETALGTPGAIGHWMMNRGAEAGAGKYTVERDSSLLLTRTQASTALSSSALSIHNSTGSTQNTKQIFCVHVGKALDSTQRAGLRAAIATYKAALGA